MNVSRQTRAPEDTGTASLLVVEDDAIVARDLQNELKGMGYRVCDVIRKGEWALEAARKHRPDLVLMDIRLAGEMDGVEAGHAIVGELEIPLVYLTAYADDQTRSRVRATAPFGYVVKPFTERDLMTTVEVALLRHQMEKQLDAERAQVRRLAEIVESTSDFVGMASADGSTLWVNRPGRRMLGIPEDEDLLGVPISKHSPDWAARKIIQEGLPGARREGIWKGETALRIRDGREIPVSQVIVAHGGEGEDVDHYSTIARDISDRKRAQRQLQESDYRFRQMADAIEEVFWLRDPITGEMLYVSPAYEKIWGRPVEELQEDPGAWIEAVHPEDRDRIAEKILEDRALGYEEMYRIVRPDGEVRWIEDRAFPVAVEDGQVDRVAGVASDITERRRAHRESKTQQRMLSRILQTAAEGILLTDAEGSFRYANPAAEEILGLEASEIEDRTYSDPKWEICGPDGGPFPDERLPVAQVLRSQEAVTDVEHGVVRPDGSRIVLSVNANPLSDADGQLTGVVSTIRDVTEQRQFEAQLQERALHDYLTGLPNRALLHDRLEYALARAERAGHPLAVLFIDLKRFKVVNDSLGHDAGDRVLEEVARRLDRAVRSQDTVARIGGDEFIVLVEEVDGEGGAVEVAERLVDAFGSPVSLEMQDVPLEASIGVVVHHGGEDREVDGSQLVQWADTAMYRAKQMPGTGYAVAEPTEERPSETLLQMETHLREALQEGRIRTVYQPIYSLESGRIRAVEALARWHEPELGDISPGTFIPLAENTGLIITLGEQQLELACSQLLEEGHVAASGDPSDRDLRLHVNLSARQLEDPNVVERISRIVEETGFPPSCLCLEITESSAMREPEAVDQLKGIGVHLAIDDFGTRYSTLSQLRRLKVDALKIDRTFVNGLPGDEKDRAIVETILTLGRTLKLEIVAEGIESDDQLRALEELGCDEAQGFFLARPRPLEELRDELKEGGS
jgi:diguanylate cyclase (GGDEF)-like protein/PAS domain S-box-containing protein